MSTHIETADDDRRSFERWISAPPYDHMCYRAGAESAWPGQYKRYETQLAWDAWQAALRQVRGEKAGVLAKTQILDASSLPDDA